MADIEYIRDDTGSGGWLRALSPDGKRHLDGYAKDTYGWVKFPRLDATMEFLKNNNATISEGVSISVAETPVSEERTYISLLVRAFGMLNWALGVMEATDAKLDLSGLSEISGDIAEFLSLKGD